MNNIQAELLKKEVEFGMKEKIMLEIEEENFCKDLIAAGRELPDGVYATEYNTFYCVRDVGVTDEEINKWISFKQLDYLKSIKNGVNFLILLVVVSILLTFMLGL